MGLFEKLLGPAVSGRAMGNKMPMDFSPADEQAAVFDMAKPGGAANIALGPRGHHSRDF